MTEPAGLSPELAKRLRTNLGLEEGEHLDVVAVHHAEAMPVSHGFVAPEQGGVTVAAAAIGGTIGEDVARRALDREIARRPIFDPAIEGTLRVERWAPDPQVVRLTLPPDARNEEPEQHIIDGRGGQAARRFSTPSGRFVLVIEGLDVLLLRNTEILRTFRDRREALVARPGMESWPGPALILGSVEPATWLREQSERLLAAGDAFGGAAALGTVVRLFAGRDRTANRAILLLTMAGDSLADRLRSALMGVSEEGWKAWREGIEAAAVDALGRLNDTIQDSKRSPGSEARARLGERVTEVALARDDIESARFVGRLSGKLDVASELIDSLDTTATLHETRLRSVSDFDHPRLAAVSTVNPGVWWAKLP